MESGWKEVEEDERATKKGGEEKEIRVKLVEEAVRR